MQMKTIVQRQKPTENTGRFHTGHLVLAILGGALAGAAVALLVAPKSGRETRHQLEGYLDTAKETVSRIPEAIRSAGQAAQETMAQEYIISKKGQPLKRNAEA
jgi:gas vesicle protein